MNARLRTLRLARSLSLDALAERMGGMITKMSLSRYERGIGQPSGAVLERLAEVLGVPVDDFSSAPPVTIEYLGYRRKPPERDAEAEAGAEAAEGDAEAERGAEAAEGDAEAEAGAEAGAELVGAAGQSIEA